MMMSLPAALAVLLAMSSTCCLAAQSDILDNLKGSRVELHTVVDIGANSGKWSRRLLEIWPSASVLMVEPSDQHAETLTKMVETLRRQNYTIDYKQALLSAKASIDIDFFEGGDTGNSIYKEFRFYEKDIPVKRSTTTLDSLLKSKHGLDLLKIDTQGSELDVLMGAKRILSNTTFVQFEYSATEYNVGAPCSWRVEEYLRERGFVLYDLGDFSYNYRAFMTPGIGQFDVAYINVARARKLEPFGHIGKVHFCRKSEELIQQSQDVDAVDGTREQNVAAAEIEELSDDFTLTFTHGLFLGLGIGVLVPQLRLLLTGRASTSRKSGLRVSLGTG